MKRLDILENKIPSIEKLDEYDKIHNGITMLGSSIGNALKRMEKLEKEVLTCREEKEPSKERIEKLEEVIDALGPTFSSLRTNGESSKYKKLKFIYVPKILNQTLICLHQKKERI